MVSGRKKPLMRACAVERRVAVAARRKVEDRIVVVLDWIIEVEEVGREEFGGCCCDVGQI
jgi:hypothetical protein